MTGHTFIDDGAHYDAYHASYSHDLPFWRSIAESEPGDILVLACGTGRVALEMARAGGRVTGLDYSPEFLRHAARKAAREGLPLALIPGDMRALPLEHRFDLVVVPFRSIAVLQSVDDLRACVQGCARALRGGGRLMLDVSHAPDAMPSKCSATPGEYASPDGSGVVRFTSANDFDERTRLVHSRLEFVHPDGSRHPASLTLRHHRLRELLDVMEAAGFHVEEHWGDYERRPFTPTDRMQILVARRR